MSAALVPALVPAAALQAAAAALIPGMRVFYKRRPAVVMDRTDAGTVVLAFMDGPKLAVLPGLVDVGPHTLQGSFDNYVKRVRNGFGMSVFVEYLMESGDVAPIKLQGTVHAIKGENYRVIYPTGDWDDYTLEELKKFKGIYEGPVQSLKVEWLEEQDDDVRILRLFVRM